MMIFTHKSVKIHILGNKVHVLIQDMEEEPGDWVAHQAEVDTLINKIQVVGTTFVLYLLLLIKMSSLVWNFSYSSKKINKE